MALTLHSTKNLYRCPGLGSLPSAMALTLDKEPLSQCYTRQSDQYTPFLFVFYIERELDLHLFSKLILVVELPNTNYWTN
jgi:hypothetical protein